MVTGGIATGKSSACAVLRECCPEAGFFDADAAVHRLLATSAVISELSAAFGPEVLRPDGVVDRPHLRTRIHADPAAKALLEEILHPRVRAEFAAMLAAQGHGLLIADVPLFFETGANYPADRVIVVAVAPATQRTRLVLRSGWPETAVEQALASQWPVSAKLAIADTVWWNEGPPGVLARQIRRCCAAWHPRR